MTPSATDNISFIKIWVMRGALTTKDMIENIFFGFKCLVFVVIQLSRASLSSSSWRRDFSSKIEILSGWFSWIDPLTGIGWRFVWAKNLCCCCCQVVEDVIDVSCNGKNCAHLPHLTEMDHTWVNWYHEEPLFLLSSKMREKLFRHQRQYESSLIIIVVRLAPYGKLNDDEDGEDREKALLQKKIVNMKSESECGSHSTMSSGGGGFFMRCSFNIFL